MVDQAIEIPNYPKEFVKEKIVPEAYQWCLTNGLTMYPAKDFCSNSNIAAPVTLYPTAIPKSCFEEAVSLQRGFNEVYAKIAQDSADNWLTTELSEFAKADPDFTGKLWELYLKAKEEGITQKLRLGIFRNDFLIDEKLQQIKQVEFNTVSVSFAGLSTKVGELHKFLNDSGKYAPDGSRYYTGEMPVSESATAFARSMANALEKYSGKNPIILFVVQENERNVFDQRTLEYNLFKNHGIRVVRLTISQIATHTTMSNDKTKKLYLKSTGEEIGLVYFRAGYTPNDYKTEQDWKNRLQLEVCQAIKAPDLLTQLSGSKKIQQLLANEDILTKFCPEKSERYNLMNSFVKIYPLDDTPLGKLGKELALKKPESYVLKPQREGGGNNIYKEDIPGFISNLSKKDMEAYILMELIEPKSNANVLLRGSEILKEGCINELGVYGSILFDDEKIYSNENCGSLLRSKFTSSNEGGVAAGYGFLDSYVLY